MSGKQQKQKQQNNKKKNNTVKKEVKKIQKTAGLARVGKMVGPMLARGARAAASSLFAHITGRGTYNVSRNSLATQSWVGDTASGRPPLFGNDRGFEFSHSEYVADVFSSALFSTSVYHLNPGQAATFPFLSQLANMFEEFDMLGCVWNYRPTCGPVVTGTNNSQGSVLLSTQYDTYDSEFTNKLEMEAQQYTTQCVPYEGMLHPVECKPSTEALKNYFVLQDGIQPAGDKRFYVPGKTTIATVGQQTSGVTLGELWVTYHFRFRLPKIDTTAGPTIQNTHSFLPVGTLSSGANKDYSALNTVRQPGETVNCAWDYNGTDTRLLIGTPGEYLLIAEWTTATGAQTITQTVNWSGTAGQNFSFTNWFDNPTTADVAPFTIVGNGTDHLITTARVRTTGVGNLSGNVMHGNPAVLNCPRISLLGAVADFRCSFYILEMNEIVTMKLAETKVFAASRDPRRLVPSSIARQLCEEKAEQVLDERSAPVGRFNTNLRPRRAEGTLDRLQRVGCEMPTLGEEEFDDYDMTTLELVRAKQDVVSEVKPHPAALLKQYAKTRLARY